MIVHKLLIVGVVLLIAQFSAAQKLRHFSWEQDDGNPHKFLLQPRVDHVFKTGDSVLLVITWLDQYCDLERKIRLDKVKGDTLFFSYSDSDGNSFSPCAYRVKLLLSHAKLTDYKVVFGKVKLDNKKKRYHADGCVVEYYRGMGDERKVFREIYLEDGKLLVEVFYDNDGRITSEKYYNRSWGYLIRERKY